MLIMGMLRVLCIGFYLLTIFEGFYGFTDGSLDCCREGLTNGCLYGSGDEFHSRF
jgi:hypothetical protein